VRRHLLVVAHLALAGLGVIACGETADDGGEGALEAMVLETCAPGADPVESDVCRCAYRELRDRLDAEELERLDRQLRDDPDTVPPEVQEVVLACGFEVVTPPTAKPSSTTTATSTTSSSAPRTSTTRP